MDNMKYYSDNLAHDFDMFMPKKKEEHKPEQKAQPKVIRMPQNKKKANFKFSQRAFTIVMITLIVATAFTSLILRTQISQLGTEISIAEQEGQKLKSEETRLNVELQKKTSTGNLEQKAKALGMQKMSKNQIYYIFPEDEQTEVQ